MIPNRPLDPVDPSLDLSGWEALSSEGIELSPDHLGQAISISQSVPHADQQWHVYVQALALSGIKEWLAEWASDLDVSDANCSIFNPPLANVLDAVCQVSVNGFDLCFIVVGHVVNETIAVPRAVVDIPQFTPHIYLLVQVLEDQMEVNLWGYLRRDQWVNQQQVQGVRSLSDKTYGIPLTWFNSDLSILLAELRCLQPAAMPQARPTFKAPLTLAQLRSRLAELRPQIQAAERSVAQLLTGDELISLLTYPALLDEVYQMQPCSPVTHAPGRIEQPLPLISLPTPSQPAALTRQAINVGHWLGDRLGELAQELSWTLMPAFATSAALRSVGNELEDRGVHIPTEARGAFQDVRVGNTALRLHVITWILPCTNGVPGWTLLAILGAQPDARLPIGTTLQIRDEHHLLTEHLLEDEIQDAYLYAQVGGRWHEVFWITIKLLDGSVLTLPPFAISHE